MLLGVCVSDGRSSATAILGHTHTSLGREDSREGGDYARCIEQVKAGVQGESRLRLYTLAMCISKRVPEGSLVKVKIA